MNCGIISVMMQVRLNESWLGYQVMLIKYFLLGFMVKVNMNGICSMYE